MLNNQWKVIDTRYWHTPPTTIELQHTDTRHLSKTIFIIRSRTKGEYRNVPTDQPNDITRNFRSHTQRN